MDVCASASASQGSLRLLFLTDCPIAASGGSERFLRNLVNGLAQEQFSISVVQLCDEPPAAARVYEAAIPSSIDFRYLPCSAVYDRSGVHAYRILRRIVMRQGFHVIQSQHENADVFNALLPRGRLGAIRISNRRDTGFLKSAKLRLASRFLNRRYDRIIAPTPAILDAVTTRENALRNRMLCIPNGVDTSHFRPADNGVRERLRASLGFAADTLLLGCVADMFAVKRHVDLVDAFAQVHNAFPQAKLVLIGDGPLREAIEEQVRNHCMDSCVHLLGTRMDVDRILPALDLFVLASDTEGLSNAILEAAACALPVIATRVGGNPDLVDDQTGMLVPARAPAALARAVSSLLSDSTLRVRMGVAARARVVRHHSLRTMTQAYAALYHEHAHAY